MPSEIRHLLFKAPEVVQAVQSHLRRQGKPLAAGFVGDCVITGDGIRSPLAFVLRVHGNSSADKVVEISVDSVTLVAALLMHCREKQIPMSAKAAKSLQRMGEQICLVATLG